MLVVEHSLLNMDFTREMVLDEMRGMLSDARIPKLMHDAKAAVPMLRAHGIEPKGIVFDTKLAEYVIDPGTSDYSLRAIAEKYGVSGGAAAIARHYPIQKKLLDDKRSWFIYSKIEAPLMQGCLTWSVPASELILVRCALTTPLSPRRFMRLPVRLRA
jgi:DNA polymerase I-like protein with 3'-5' exonuclease and polymerase domains